MFRSLIFVAMMATQLFARSAGAVFLCVCNDGSAVCICPGPSACTCCGKYCEGSIERCVNKTSREAEPERCCENCAETPAKEDVFPAIDAPCGCTFFPLMVESDQPTTMIRCAAMEVEWNSHLVALLPTCVEIDELDLRLHQWRMLPPLASPDFFLTVISTVVIRC